MKPLDSLIQLFEQHRFGEAILGSEDFFVEDYTWRNHDILWVLRHLNRWLAGNSNAGVIEEIQNVFEGQIMNDKTISPIDKGLNFMMLIRAFCINATEHNAWFIDPSFFIDRLRRRIERFNDEEINVYRIRRDVDDLEKYIPGVVSSVFDSRK